MTGARDWQGTVGRNWAQEQARTDRSFAGMTPHLLEAVAAERGTRIVDIGCGAGELSRAIAAVRPDAQVTGVDISADLIAAASARGHPGNLRFELADASAWQPQTAPDLYASRHGVMFFPHPPGAFAHLAAVAAPGARMVFSCFRAAAENGWASGIARLLPPSAPAPAQTFPPGPFAFADPAHVRACMAGWKDITFTPVDFAYVAGAGSDPVADAMDFFARIGPAAAAIRELPQSARESFLQRLEALARDHLVGGQVAFPAAAWLVRATVDH
ncbi:MAG: hypothetical protein RIS94_1925 [Pseudomonadota bacterium]|jgi:SAM-dependent methyltransferase